MNYVDINKTSDHILTLNSRAESNVSITWVILEEGSETPEKTFTSSLIARPYYQELRFGHADFKAHTFYTLEGKIGNEVVYRGKIYAIDGTDKKTKFSSGKYTANPITNDYLILE